MKDTVLALYKKLLSYRKTEWEIEDYPLKYRNQSNFDDKEIKPWVVQVVNWWVLVGVGDTKTEAYNMLKEDFENYKEHNELPRPGSKVQLKFADTTEIDNLEYLAVDFFDKILGQNYYECFISDESSLFDFGKDNQETIQKINEVYNLSSNEIGDGNIIRILKLIKEKGSL